MRIRRLVAATAIALASFVPVAHASTSPYATVKASACQTEDQTSPCYWDASKHGNKKGLSFYVMPNHSKGVIFKGDKRVVVNLPKGSIVYDTNATRADGYVRKSTTSNVWVIVCPKTWTLEQIDDAAFACD